MYSLLRIISWLVALMLLVRPIMAEGGYKTYDREEKNTVLFTLMMTEENWEFQLNDSGTIVTYNFSRPERSIKNGTVNCNDQVVIDNRGVEFPEIYYAFDDIKKIDVFTTIDDEALTLTFYGFNAEQQESSFRRRMKDRVYVDRKVSVENGDFVLGSVIAFGGSLEIFGEVNNDVVAIDTDIRINDGAVVRGNVIAVAGDIETSTNMSVYGFIKSKNTGSSTRRNRARRWKHYGNEIELTGTGYYNRVDGLALIGGLKYEHTDSLLPWFQAVGGYAFASNRWRWKLNLTQTVIRGRFPVQIGGEYFRLLKSDDDKLISEAENSIFAILVNEDWKDYYEAEGGYVFARVKALHNHTFEIGYLSQDERWLDAHPRLWSIFGDKDFRGNFSSVTYAVKRAYIDSLDDKRVASLNLRYTVDTRDDADQPYRGWYGFATYESSPKGSASDFDFKRFEARLRRFQPLSRYQALHLTGAYGYLEGDKIPLNRYYYLGGLGTVHGYRHKEYMGKEYLLLSGEYRFRIPHSDLTPFVHFDAGRIGAERLSSDDSWKFGAGIGIDVSRNFRIFMSKRLDDSDADVKFYARFSAALL